MAVEVFDLLKIAHEEGKRKPIFNSERLHAWVHVYANTGDKDTAQCGTYCACQIVDGRIERDCIL